MLRRAEKPTHGLMAELRLACEREIRIHRERASLAASSFHRSLLSIRSMADETLANRGSASRRKLPDKFTTSFLRQFMKTTDRHMIMTRQICRCSMTSETQHNLASHEEVLAFIKSTFGELKGPNHHWLNTVDGSIKSFSQDGIFLVLVNASLDDSTSHSHHDCIFPIERIKLLQQRYPKLNVFALQCGSSANSIATHTQLTQTIIEEYVTYPVLISEKNFAKVTNGGCYLLFEGSTNRLFHFKLDEELGTLAKVIEEFGVLQKDSAATIQNSNFDRIRQLEVIKEPYICSYRNLLLYYPGCLSVDEDGNHIFISDSNHHRIIIADGDGKILDCVSRMVNLDLPNYFDLLDPFIALLIKAYILWTLSRIMQLEELIWKKGCWRLYTL